MEFSLVTLEDKKANQEMVVTQSNTLVEAKYYLSLYEQRLILMLISMVEPNDEDFKNYAIKVNDFRDLIGLKTKNLHLKVKSLLRGLRNKDIEIPKGGENYLITGWISDAEYKDGIVYISFSAKLKPYLIALKTNFTSHKLGVAIRFKGVYTIRIYTLLKQYEKIGERFFSLEDFRDILGVKDGQYSQFFDFKRRTVTQAQKEFSEKKDGVFVSDINFNFEPIKTGRKVTGLKFHIFEQSTKPKKEQNPSISPPKTGEDQGKSNIPEIQKMLDVGVAKKKAVSLLNEYGKENIINAIGHTAEEERDSPAGFFLSSLKNSWEGTAQQKAGNKQAKAEAKKQKEKREKEVMKETEKLASQYSKQAIERYLLDFSETEKKEKLEELKTGLPDVLQKQMTTLSAGAGAGFLVLEIPDYEKNKKIFIKSGLEKMGLLKPLTK